MRILGCGDSQKIIKMKGFVLLISLLYFIGMIFLSVMLLYEHEEVHVSIYDAYGIDSEVEYIRSDLTARTIPNYENTTRRCNETCHMLHEINEIVGYHANAFFALIGLGFLFTILMLGIIAYLIYHLEMK